MATRESTTKTAGTGLIATLVRIVLIGSFTGIETAALAIWLAFVRDAPVLSRATAIGLGVLAVGLVLEHVLTDLAVNGLDLSLPGGRVAAFSISETALWGLWLVIAEQVGGLVGVAVAGLVLAVLLVPQHSIEDSVLRGDGFLSDFLIPGTIGFSLVEAAGATGWLALVLHGELVESHLGTLGLAGTDPAVLGVGFLAIALFIEHVIGVRFARRA